MRCTAVSAPPDSNAPSAVNAPPDNNASSAVGAPPDGNAPSAVDAPRDSNAPSAGEVRVCDWEGQVAGRLHLTVLGDRCYCEALVALLTSTGRLFF